MAEHRSFKTPAELDAWFAKHHASHTELWVRMFKKESGRPSVTWDDCVVACLTWGWIDGVRKSLDEISFVQRLTPRRAKSNWSQRNREIAERLIAEGTIRPTGLAQVEAARADGRWDRASAGPAGAKIPDDFLAALNKNTAAKKFFATLGKTNLFAIYYRVHTARTPELRAKRIADIVARLAEKRPFHPEASASQSASKPRTTRRTNGK